MDKVIEEGNVAVLVSPGFGAGWYSWEHDESMLFDPGLVQLILNGAEFGKKINYVENKWPDAYTGGIEDLEVQWVPEGTEFLIDEYDGAESIVYKEHGNWFKA